MIEILILCGIYLVELACYQLGLRILFEVKQKNRMWMLAGLVLPVVIGVLPVEASGKNVVITISAMIVVVMSMEGGLAEKLVKLVLVFLLLVCMEDFLTCFCGKVFKFQGIYIENLKYFETKCYTASSITILNAIKRKVFKNKKTHIDLGIYIVIGIIAVSMMFCLAVLNYVKIYLPNNKWMIFCNIINVAIHISILLLVVFIIYIKSTNERMERLLKSEQLLKESQVNYYKQVLKKEIDTRKYRHDMVNHLIYLQDILNKGKIDDAINYVYGILGGFKKIQNTYYVIGNEMVDAIMNYYFGMLPLDVEINIKGRCPVKLNVKDIDVCTIFANVFQNAVEEILRNHISEAKIIIEVKKGKQYVEYNVKNSLFTSINKNSIGKDGLPKSYKMDKKNHGIGMANTKDAIEKNNGKFEWYQQEGYFCVNIILPIQ